MVTQREIENQEVMIECLKSEMAMLANLPADRWDTQKGYMPTCEYDNRVGPGTWTEGIDYVVLDEDNISMRLSGDYRDNSNWEVVSPDEFRKLVIQHAKMVLENWREEHALESA